MSGVELPRFSKGEKPRFFETEGLDELYGVVTSLAAELAAAYERIDTLERVMAVEGLIAPGQVEKFQRDSSARAERADWHHEYVDRVFSPLRHRGSGLDKHPDDGTTTAD